MDPAWKIGKIGTRVPLPWQHWMAAATRVLWRATAAKTEGEAESEGGSQCVMFGMIFSMTRFCPLGVRASSSGVLVALISLVLSKREKATLRVFSVLFFDCLSNS